MYRYIVLAGRTAGLWVAQVVVKVETDEDNHSLKGRWRRRSAWRTYLALDTCLLCTLSYLFFWVYPPPALHDDHFSVFSATYVILQHCYCLLCTCMCQLQFFWSAYHSMYLRPCTCLLSAYFDFSAFEWYLFHVPQGGRNEMCQAKLHPSRMGYNRTVCKQQLPYTKW